jgi:bifunctional DNA-binding transcriptional regulator/antitoxin component of YhaV-PrlF toxin-antitoxin module
VTTFTVQVAQRGLITLPKALRDEHGIHIGDEFTLLDLDGVFVLSRRPSNVDALADRLAGDLAQRGETLESMLQALREVRAGGE